MSISCNKKVSICANCWIVWMGHYQRKYMTFFIVSCLLLLHNKLFQNWVCETTTLILLMILWIMNTGRAWEDSSLLGFFMQLQSDVIWAVLSEDLIDLHTGDGLLRGWQLTRAITWGSAGAVNQNSCAWHLQRGSVSMVRPLTGDWLPCEQASQENQGKIDSFSDQALIGIHLVLLNPLVESRHSPPRHKERD